MVRRAVRRQETRALNIISHLLSKIPYEEVPGEKVKLPKRQAAEGYREPDYPFKFIPEMAGPPRKAASVRKNNKYLPAGGL